VILEIRLIFKPPHVGCRLTFLQNCRLTPGFRPIYWEDSYDYNLDGCNRNHPFCIQLLLVVSKNKILLRKCPRFLCGLGQREVRDERSISIAWVFLNAALDPWDRRYQNLCIEYIAILSLGFLPSDPEVWLNFRLQSWQLESLRWLTLQHFLQMLNKDRKSSINVWKQFKKKGHWNNWRQLTLSLAIVQISS
jgi:hypothetical protein